MRILAATLCFAVVSAIVVNADLPAQEKKQPPKKKADPKSFHPDATTLKQITEKTEQLRKAVAALKEKKIADDVLIEVEIYLKAAENIVRFEEWLAANSVKWTLQTLDQGLARAKQAEGGKAIWRDAPGRWVNRAYRSRIDNSIQPYAVLLPHDYGKDPNKKWRLDIVLHGRDGALTEAKFIATHNGAAPKDLGYVQLEPYGRGNNAYRWAGETDVRLAEFDFFYAPRRRAGMEKYEPIDLGRIVLRGFSMGGAGTWHIGLHCPDKFCVIGPGAGFTTTHGYITALPKELPDYQEKCLRIYDAYLYAENSFNVPVVAYSGENDAQKKAADNIENALKNFKKPLKFTHLVAPGLAHQMPKEWQDKAEAEYRKFADMRKPRASRVHFVTYTTLYHSFAWGSIEGLGQHYERAIVDGFCELGAENSDELKSLELKTENVSAISLSDLMAPQSFPRSIIIDGQAVEVQRAEGEPYVKQRLVKRDGKWTKITADEWQAGLVKSPRKRPYNQGPIDDAFTGCFVVIAPTGDGWFQRTSQHSMEELAQFAKVWDKYFRGTLPAAKPTEYDPKKHCNLVLFGDPQSNPLIAKVLPKLPITWTKEQLVVNGVEYDPKTHVPVLIYPNPLNENKAYVVLNSGHTFKEADLKGTNALLYPRLGDWAVIKPTPNAKDSAAYEVVAAGLFDENWQFPKKK